MLFRSAGRVERRGLRIEPASFCRKAVLRLVVKMVSGPEAAAVARLPWEEAPVVTRILGVTLPLLPLDSARDRGDQVAMVIAAVKIAAPQNAA